MMKLPAAPLQPVPSLICASAVLLNTLTAEDAPMPALSPLPPSPDGTAVENASAVLVAAMVTSPLPVMAIAADALTPGSARPITASTSLVMMFTATEPATPIFPPPPPEVADAKEELVWSINC